MEIRLHKKHIFILIASLAIMLLLYVGAYLLLLSPANQRIEQIESTLALLDKQINILSTSEQEEPITNSYSLQKQVPVKPLVDQFVLDLEKAEVVSNSEIQTIEFAEDGEQLSSEQEEPALQADLDSTESGETEQETANLVAPEGMKQLTILLTVTSHSYYDLKTFIDTIEQQTRMTKVEQLKFTGPPEITQINQKVENIDYEMKLSAYYYSTLTDLEDEMPTLEVPLPGLKNSPLIPYISEDKEEQS